jgi:hypothetical protein
VANDLVVVSDKKRAKGQRLVVRNYDQNPKPCRRGYWIGRQENFEQTVMLAANIEPERHPFIGFSVNGTMVIKPGVGPFTNPLTTPPGGEPCPGLPSVKYICPVGNNHNQIAFTSTAGDPQTCFWVQAFFLHHGEDPNAPPHAGPWTSVCLAGSLIEWPAYLILQEQACLKRWAEIMRRYSEAAEVGPLDLVEILAGLPEQDSMLLQAAAQTLEEINAQDQPALANALQESVVGILRSRMPRRAASPTAAETGTGDS